MNYLIFDNEIYYETNGKTGIAQKDRLQDVFSVPKDGFAVAMIDTLQKTVAAPEKDSFKKDEILAGSFSADYVIQSEKVGRNLFQVIAVEKKIVNEIYACLDLENIKRVVPYAVALREFLKKSLDESKKKIVFLDHLGNQILLTIFNNSLFTTPRRLPLESLGEIDTELERSLGNYRGQHQEERESVFLTVTNSEVIREKLISSDRMVKENIVLLAESYPALAGLRNGEFSLHYFLPEVLIQRRKLQVLRMRAFSFGLVLSAFLVFLVIFLFSFAQHKNALLRLDSLNLEERSLSESLVRAYQSKYQDILRHKQKINFGQYIYSFLDALPRGYKAESISIKQVANGAYRFEAAVCQEEKDRPFADFKLPRIFKDAVKENIFVKGSPGIRVILDI